MSRSAKSEQLQIRVSPAEKTAIGEAAQRAGMDMSAYVLARVLPSAAQRFAALCAACGDPAGTRLALAELGRWLGGLGAAELRQAVEPPPTGLRPFLGSYIAAMVEWACARRCIAPPAWTRSMGPLREPMFGSSLTSLRMHLLTKSPAPFRSRNIFVDSSIGDQV